ncbi:MAG: M48 family peptidase [Terriglobales bacterium]
MTRDLEPTFLAVFRELKPRTPLPALEVAFYPFAHINNTIRLRQGRLLVRLSDLLQSAPELVLEALAHILLRKLYRHPIPEVYNARYRRFIGQKDIVAKSHLIRQIRGRKQLEPPQGRHYDLDAIYDDLNLRFFQGWMARPNLGWSAAEARRNLGHYDPAHNAILISRIFDSARVPKFALEYVLYHEMLHLRYPVRMRGSRRCVHSAEFRAEERRFPGWAEAEAALKRL